jgi:hypothetical protein
MAIQSTAANTSHRMFTNKLWFSQLETEEETTPPAPALAITASVVFLLAMPMAPSLLGSFDKPLDYTTWDPITML